MQAMTRDQLRSVCPSIFTRSAYRTLTPRYRVAASADVVDLLEGIGLFPVRAQQSRCRLPDKKDYVKHLIRFRRSEDLAALVATEIPEVVLTNSFDGTTAYRLDLGLFRVACLNGLVCPTSALGSISVRHSGGDDFGQRIIQATHQVVEHAPTILNTINEWKGIELSRPRQLEFSEQAMSLKPNSNIQPIQLLTSQRRADDTDAEGNRDLYRTMNVCHEHLMRGGLQARNGRGRQIRTRPVRAVQADLNINKGLWRLAESFASN